MRRDSGTKKKDVVFLDGVRFVRYPESPNLTHRRYYQNHKHGFFHRCVWEKHNGPIPEGMHVHHVDENPLNNDPSNLKLVTAAEHRGYHRSASLRMLRHLEEVRPLASAWHRSPEGRTWHSKNAKEAVRTVKTVNCHQCGKETQTKLRKSVNFCSNACCAAARRASGVDDVVRVCVWCSSEFRVNRYAKAKSCSNRCARRYHSSITPKKPPKVRVWRKWDCTCPTGRCLKCRTLSKQAAS